MDVLLLIRPPGSMSPMAVSVPTVQGGRVREKWQSWSKIGGGEAGAVGELWGWCGVFQSSAQNSLPFFSSRSRAAFDGNNALSMYSVPLIQEPHLRPPIALGTVAAITTLTDDTDGSYPYQSDEAGRLCSHRVQGPSMTLSVHLGPHYNEPIVSVSTVSGQASQQPTSPAPTLFSVA